MNTKTKSKDLILGIDLGGRELAVLEALPQSTYMLASEAGYASELLYWLLDEIAHRQRIGFTKPHLFLFIDEVAGLLDLMGPKVNSLLHEIAVKGKHAGVHMVGACRSIVFDQLPSLRALPGMAHAFPEQALDGEPPSIVGRFVFQERHNKTRVDIAWLTARDLDAAVDLVRSGWRACERR